MNHLRIICYGIAFGLWGTLLLAAPAMAQDKGWQQLRQQGFQVQIRASTKLLFLVRRDTRGRPLLVGQLTDDRNQGLPDQSLTLRLPNQTIVKARTESDGRFILSTKGWPRIGLFVMRYPGATGYGPTQRKRKLDLRRVDLEISPSFPPPLASGSHRFEIKVRLTYDGQPLRRFPLTLYLGKPQAQEQTGPPPDKDLWPLMTLRSDRQGELRFVWEGRALEGPASLPLVFGYAGGRFFLPQRRIYRLLILSPPQDQRWQWWWSIALISVVLLGSLFFGVQLLLSFVRNRQSDMHHLPVPTPIHTLPALRDLGVGPDVKDDTLIAGWILDSSSREPIPGAHIVVEHLTTLPSPSLQTPEFSAISSHEVASGGDKLVDPAEMPQIDEPDEGGRMGAQDPQDPAQLLRTRSDEFGRFVLPLTAHGEVKLRIYHTFYRSKRLTLTLPHQGPGRRLQVQITSYRELIYRMFAQAVWRLSPEKPLDPQRQTARELIDTIPQPEAQQLYPLASLFEESYYGPEMPASAHYSQAVQQLSDIRIPEAPKPPQDGASKAESQISPATNTTPPPTQV